MVKLISYDYLVAYIKGEYAKIIKDWNAEINIM